MNSLILVLTATTTLMGSHDTSLVKDSIYQVETYGSNTPYRFYGQKLNYNDKHVEIYAFDMEACRLHEQYPGAIKSEVLTTEGSRWPWSKSHFIMDSDYSRGSCIVTLDKHHAVDYNNQLNYPYQYYDNSENRHYNSNSRVYVNNQTYGHNHNHAVANPRIVINRRTTRPRTVVRVGNGSTWKHHHGKRHHYKKKKWNKKHQHRHNHRRHHRKYHH